MNDWLKIWDHTLRFFRTVRVYWGLFNGDVIFVGRLEDLPDSIDGERFLLDFKTYYFTRKIDLLGDVLVGGVKTCVLGFSSENSGITSTGKPVDVPLIRSNYTTPIRHITFYDVNLAIDFDGDGNTMALDWTGVNFENVPEIGTIKNASNFIYSIGAFINSKNIYFDGEIGTVAFNNSLLQGDGEIGSIINVQDTCVIQRRFRINLCAIVAFENTDGINFSETAIVPNEKYILDTCDFSGDGFYVTGVQHYDNKALFKDCDGIDNSDYIAEFFMLANSTVTVVSAASTPTKILGTTDFNDITERFRITDNRATYTGAKPRKFKVTTVVSCESGTNHQIGLYIVKIVPDGMGGETVEILDRSEQYVTTDGNNKAANNYVQTLVRLNPGESIENWAENGNSPPQNITVTYLNTIIQ